MTWPVFLLALIEAVIIARVGSRDDPNYICGAGVCSNMVLISLFAPVLIAVFGFVTNVGVVFYAAVVSAQCVILERFGTHVARESLPSVYVRLVTIWGCSSALTFIPIQVGNEQFGDAVRIVTERQISIVVASFAAFALSQMVLLLFYDRYRHALGRWRAIILGTVVCHLVDTPIFFLIAFYDHPLGVWSLMLTGFLSRLLFSVMFLPAVYFAVERRRVLNFESSRMATGQRPPNMTGRPALW